MPNSVDQAAPSVRAFRSELNAALDAVDSEGRKWSGAKWGVYVFYDYEGEPIYVGQTNEQLRVRVRRHLTNQRTDAVAMRVLDVFEVAEVEFFPLWEYEGLKASPERKGRLNALEYSVYLTALAESRYHAILNEVVPPVSRPIQLPASYRHRLVSGQRLEDAQHADVRIARRAETIARLAAVVHERGVVTEGLRRVLIVQAVRLAHLAARRLAAIEGRPEPGAESIQTLDLIGNPFVDVDQAESPD